MLQGSNEGKNQSADGKPLTAEIPVSTGNTGDAATQTKPAGREDRLKLIMAEKNRQEEAKRLLEQKSILEQELRKKQDRELRERQAAAAARRKLQSEGKNAFAAETANNFPETAAQLAAAQQIRVKQPAAEPAAAQAPVVQTADAQTLAQAPVAQTADAQMPAQATVVQTADAQTPEKPQPASELKLKSRTAQSVQNLKAAREALAEQKAAEDQQEQDVKQAQRPPTPEEYEEARQKAIEMVGGIISVYDTNINTEIKAVTGFTWKELLGIVDRQQMKEASTEEEIQAVREQADERKEEARAIVSSLASEKVSEYRRSPFGRFMTAIKTFCDAHKAPLLVTLAVILTVCTAAAGVFNYCTAYSYSYNGVKLGYVKQQEKVLAITDMVSAALTEDKNMDVVIDQKKDITFQRENIINKDVQIDTEEDVLKKLTYVGDLNVEGFGIYVDGRRIGTVEDKDTAGEVLTGMMDRCTSDKGDSEVEEVVFIEKVEIKQTNSNLSDLYTKDEMIDKLCAVENKETIHIVEAGETLADIAQLFSVKPEALQADNPNVKPDDLKTGTAIVIKQKTPVLSVKITEVVTYDKTVKHEIKKKKTDKIYEGYTEKKKEGENGKSRITARRVSINGETIQEDVLETKVLKKPVTEVILVGTKERPPTVGSGKYIWPREGSYGVTSNYGYRWGRLHAGIDIGMPVGTNILAADGGTVVKAEYYGGYGYMIDIDHQNGMTTRYAHCSQLLVSEGDKVFQGQHIAESGNTGNSTGPHLHFEIHVNGETKDPLTYLP